MNLQQIPSYTNLIRNAFIADEGRLLASLDFSSQELRILTEISGDKVMYEIFTTGGDVHSTTAVTIWNNKFPDKKTDIDTFQRLRKVSETFRDKDGNIDYKKIDDDIHLDRALKEGIILTKDRDTLIKEIELGLEYEKMRGKAKAVNFSIVYGTTPIGLAENLEITEEEAMMYIQSYKQTYPGVAKWMEETKKQVREKMYVETLLGRKRRLYPEVTSGQQWLLESAYRVGMNSPIQGCLDIETPILTTEGYVPIKDITNHELVTFSGTTKDYKVWNSGEKKLYRLNTLHTSIDATAEHRFAIYDKGELIFVPLESLKVGDIIAIANYTPKVAVTDNDMTIVPRDLIMDVYKVLRKDKELFKKLTASERSHVYRFKQGSATKDSCLKYLKMCEETEEVNRFIYLLDTISFTKITSIEDLGVRPTMDIEIFTEDHSYIASNFMCHNSAADMTKKATIDLQPALKKYDCNILLWVHDK